MTTLEQWLSATVIASLVGLWHALTAWTPGPQSGPVPDGPRVLSHRVRPRARRDARPVTLTRRTA